MGWLGLRPYPRITTGPGDSQWLVSRPTRLLTAPVTAGGRRRRAYAGGGGGVSVLPGAPGPTGGVAGLDTSPLGRPTCCRPPHDCYGHGGRPALSALLDSQGTGGAALSWAYHPPAPCGRVRRRAIPHGARCRGVSATPCTAARTGQGGRGVRGVRGGVGGWYPRPLSPGAPEEAIPPRSPQEAPILLDGPSRENRSVLNAAVVEGG